MRFLFKAAAVSAALMLGGCNDGADSTGTTTSAVGVESVPVTTPTISTSVVQGQIRNAVLTASRWQGTGYVTVATTMSDAAGNFTLSMPDSVAGYVKLEMSLSTDPARPTEMLCVAAQCGSATFGQWYPLTENPRMSSWALVASNGSVTTQPLTPFSTMAVRYAEKLGGGFLSSTAVNLARKRVALLLGVSIGTLGLTPGNVTNPTFVRTTNPASLKWSMLTAAFADLAETQGRSLSAVIDSYSTAFQKYNGQLLQTADGLPAQSSLAALIRAAINVDTAARGTAALTLQPWLDLQVAGELTPLPAWTFDSSALIAGLGPMGQDITSVIQANGASTLEELIRNQLSSFRWVASQESVAIASIGTQTVVMAMLGSAVLANLTPEAVNTSIVLGSGDLNVVLNTGTRVMTLIGTSQGMNINLRLTLTALNAGSQTRPFVFSAVGSVSNANVNATINGSLRIDPKSTDLNPLLAATSGLFAGSPTALQDLLRAFGGILQSGHGFFTLTGSAGMQSVVNPASQLAVTGKAYLNVEMAGGTAGAIKAGGGVSYGTLTLPNGDSFTVDPAAGDTLTFALGDSDGTFNTRFSAYTLGLPQTLVKASGRLSGLGSLLTGMRNTVTSQLALGQLDVASLLSSLLNYDFSQLDLSMRGQANILGSYNHVYNMTLSGGRLWISQPNSTAWAISASGDLDGVLVKAGNQNYVMGLDLRNLQNPALVVGDAVNGGIWRLEASSL